MDEQSAKKEDYVFVLVRSLEYFEMEEELDSLYCRTAINSDGNCGLLNENLEGFRDARCCTTGVTDHARFKTTVEFFWARSKRQLLKCAVSCGESG
jgi:hypothetical protein